MVPDATFSSYYGRPILKPPTWNERDIAGYLFAGGLAGASSVLAASARRNGYATLATRTQTTATLAIAFGAVALVHDLGRPARFANMLRVCKPTSPMSVGAWFLAGYGPSTAVAAVTACSGRLPHVNAAATLSAGVLGSAVATYTAALVADTAVPAWHGARRELPILFAGSSAAAAGGVGMVLTPVAQSGPARRFAIGGALVETAASTVMARAGLHAEPYRTGRAGNLLRLARRLTVTGGVVAAIGRGRRVPTIAGGALLVAGSAVTRVGIFAAGVRSAEDPRYVVETQRAGQ
jgi:hypothetical protein